MALIMKFVASGYGVSVVTCDNTYDKVGQISFRWNSVSAGKNTCSRPVDKQSRPFQARKKKKERKLEFLTFNKKKTFIADVVLLWLRFLHHWTPFIPDTFYSWLCLVN